MPQGHGTGERDRPVFLVSDRPERAERLARGIAVVLRCRVVASGEPLPAARPSAWVIDCNLDQAADAPWFEALCARMEAGTPCICLARGAGIRDEAALARLGNPIVVAARQQEAGLVSILQQAIARARGAVPSAERRIGTATALVGSLFEAAASGAAPDPAEAEEGARIVLDAVSDMGIRAFLDLIWRHDITVYQHSLSVAAHAAAFAAELGFSVADRHLLAEAALLHDLGKARIPLAILNKPGPLSPEENAVMRTHAAIGADLLAASGGFARAVIDVARWHHERLDGSGYPDGLKGHEIGDLVRLVAICDVHSALTERRVYRAPMSAAQARTVMAEMSGQLDPDLLRAYLPIIARADTAV